MQEKKYQITVNSCNINTTELRKILFAYESLLELFLKLNFLLAKTRGTKQSSPNYFCCTHAPFWSI